MSRDALVIGINQYRHLQNLTSPARDAEKIAQLLKDYGQFNVVKLLPAVKDKDNTIKVGRQTLVSGVELEKTIGEFLNPEGKSVPNTALLFFSGHGVRKISGGVSEGFLAASDTSPSSGNWGLSLRWLRQVLELSPIRQQIICLDCCHSGEVLNFKEADPGNAGNAHDRCFIAASREYEPAYEEADGSHGLLSGALIKGLPPSSRADGIVTNYSLTDVVIQTLRGSQQQPVFSNSGSAIELTRQSVSFIPKEEPVSSKCPYKGLNYFDFNDEDPKYFYGRTALTEKLIDKVRKSSFLAVVGASGSGKSSIVRAGLLYKLKLGKSLADSDRWPIRIFTPDEYPMANLAWAFVDPSESNTGRARQFKEAKELIDSGINGFAALITATAGDGKVVLVIDQLEEVFTLCKKEPERRKFFEILLGALPLTENKLSLVIAMRADFFSKCTEEEYLGLSKHIQDNLVTITPMTQEELKLAIIEPAKKVKITVEQELVKQMVDDIHDSRGSLPLLQYTLTELWSKREDNTLRLSTYSAMEGVKGALAKRADEVYESLSPEEQNAAKRIFMELTHLGEGTEDTRRRVFKNALVTPKQPEELINRVIHELTRANLIVTDEVLAESKRIPVVDVAHEALIRHWPLLRQWLNSNREDIRFRHKLDDAAKEWDSQGKHDGLLWRSPLLEILKEYHNKYKDEMSNLELAFYEASTKAKEKVEQEKEEAQKREIENLKAVENERNRAQSLLVKNYWSNAVNEKKITIYWSPYITWLYQEKKNQNPL